MDIKLSSCEEKYKEERNETEFKENRVKIVKKKENRENARNIVRDSVHHDVHIESYNTTVQ